MKELFTGEFSKYLDNMQQLSDNSKKKLDSPFTLEELETSVLKSKLNKAPGPDGFSNEFFKIFMDELKHWIFRYLQESVNNKHYLVQWLRG